MCLMNTRRDSGRIYKGASAEYEVNMKTVGRDTAFYD